MSGGSSLTQAEEERDKKWKRASLQARRGRQWFRYSVVQTFRELCSSRYLRTSCSCSRRAVAETMFPPEINCPGPLQFFYLCGIQRTTTGR